MSSLWPTRLYFMTYRNLRVNAILGSSIMESIAIDTHNGYFTNNRGVNINQRILRAPTQEVAKRARK